MKKLFLPLFFLFTFYTSQPLFASTYAQVAKDQLPQALAELSEGLKIIDKDILPHEIKAPVDVRKLIVKLRDYMDFFVYALPGEREKNDPFLEIRGFLDDGYEIFGQFKDLYDTQNLEIPEDAEYKKSKVRDLRDLLLTWKKEFKKNQKNISDYLNSANNQSNLRKKKNLSDFYWGSVNFEPETKADFSLVLNSFLAELATRALEEYPTVRSIQHPGLNEEGIEAYHDFRKRLRTMLKLSLYFPEAVQLSPASSDFLTQMADSYGVISDLIAKLEVERPTLDRKQTKLLLKEIEIRWKETQNLEKGLNVPRKLKALINEFEL